MYGTGQQKCRENNDTYQEEVKMSTHTTTILKKNAINCISFLLLSSNFFFSPTTSGIFFCIFNGLLYVEYVDNLCKKSTVLLYSEKLTILFSSHYISLFPFLYLHSNEEKSHIPNTERQFTVKVHEAEFQTFAACIS